MDNDQKAAVQKFIEAKWQRRTCSQCGANAWTLVDKVFELREYSGGGMVIGGGTSIITVLPVTCSNCGNTVLVNSNVVGVTGS